MKPTTLCLSVFIVAFLLASEMPRAHGMAIVLTYKLLRLFTKELNLLMKAAGIGTNDIQLDRPTMQQVVSINLNNPKLKEEAGSERNEMSINISQKSKTDEDKETSSERRDLIKKVRKWIRSSNPLRRA